MRRNESGVMLIEALIAILIFSLGVLGIVGMQASAVGVMRDAKYRADAAMLANELLGEMWSGNRAGSTLETNFEGRTGCLTTGADGARYCAWYNNRVANALPGVANNPPIVTVTPGSPGGGSVPPTSSVVTVEVRWMAPNDTLPHHHVVVVQII